MTRRTSIAKLIAVVMMALALVPGLGACPSPGVSPRWLVVWRVGGAGGGAGAEQFRCIITRPRDAGRVSEAIARRTSAGIPFGRVRFGTAENLGHHWHMENVRLVDVTAEIYDGRPSDIDNDLIGWINTLKRYGPWSARPVQMFPMQ